jgi:hypothetical protein
VVSNNRNFDIGEGFFYEAKESLVVEQKLQQVLISMVAKLAEIYHLILYASDLT